MESLEKVAQREIYLNKKYRSRNLLFDDSRFCEPVALIKTKMENYRTLLK